MSLIAVEEAKQKMEPRFAGIRSSILDGWSEWLAMPAKQRAELTSRSRASNVHDFIVAAACRHLTDAQVMDKSDLKLFVFDESICLRFKKFNDELCTSNQPTKQVELFRRQRPLDGVPAKHNLEAGYVLDSAELSIRGIHLVCPNGNKPYWAIDLLDDDYGSPIVDLFGPDGGGAPEGEPGSEEKPSRYRRKDSGVVVPFKQDDKDA